MRYDPCMCQDGRRDIDCPTHSCAVCGSVNDSDDGADVCTHCRNEFAAEAWREQ